MGGNNRRVKCPHCGLNAWDVRVSQSDSYMRIMCTNCGFEREGAYVLEHVPESWLDAKAHNEATIIHIEDFQRVVI